MNINIPEGFEISRIELLPTRLVDKIEDFKDVRDLKKAIKKEHRFDYELSTLIEEEKKKAVQEFIDGAGEYLQQEEKRVNKE